MAGHSKWANIKRHKARVDAAKSKVFTQISREIIVAARQGLPDPEANFQLRNAVAKAKAAGIPNDNIDRAIAKGAGNLGGEDDYEAIRYEGYGPGGVAVLIEALTDNRNRTAADIRVAFSKNGGNLGETGCVSWMFAHKGVIILEGEMDEDQLLEASLEAEAESYQLLEIDEDVPGAEVYTAIEDLEQVSNHLEAAGFNVKQAELRWCPGNSLEVTDEEQGRSLLKMMDALEDLDDVQTVTSNFEMSDALLDRLSLVNS
ncbi:YebC/PmpR family DNA-binding transcriptional regulator [Geitlerinema sp. P-1104]|uniref:YebC/PmpR family DNA-binding transcriptional regulator n=1 Tax=Geitlerinema sp. P-1104 TaxID=2546230 RepID=UPI001476AF65|nr:YebC/PmpR family DNA-binding transcriptional regulator [Geitlerinema sp. P-1104]NMG57925.1 YebC/PmpR family DNA-binding transcriptional regulator [Geitlerinema sp. P-1104]